MEIIINKGRNKSGSSNLNYYAVLDKIHIMDNHLAAIHPLYKFGRSTNEINFYHIDRHYDLGGLNDYHDDYIQNIKAIPEIKTLDSVKSNMGCNVFLWDNYIHLFYSRYHNKIEDTYFLTHQTYQLSWEWGNFNQITLFQLLKFHPNGETNILNIDIDFFFYENSNGEFNLAFSESLMLEFEKWFIRNLKKFDLVIIALSPECCGGWSNSINMFQKLFPQIELKI